MMCLHPFAEENMEDYMNFSKTCDCFALCSRNSYKATVSKAYFPAVHIAKDLYRKYNLSEEYVRYEEPTTSPERKLQIFQTNEDFQRFFDGLHENTAFCANFLSTCSCTNLLFKKAHAYFAKISCSFQEELR